MDNSLSELKRKIYLIISGVFIILQEIFEVTKLTAQQINMVTPARILYHIKLPHLMKTAMDNSNN